MAYTNSKRASRNSDTVEDDDGIVVVEDEPQVDKDKINEMRRAYLEESRSQDTID